MQKRLVLKALLITVLMLLLLIPLSFIRSAVSERAERRDAVQADIAGKTSSRQTIAGPLIVQPYKLFRPMQEKDKEGNLRTRIEETQEWAFVYPKKLDIKGDVQTETRKRGIFEALVYQTELDLAGEFQVPPQAGIKPAAGVRIELQAPYLVVGLSDNRGIVNTPEIQLGNTTLPFAPGQNLPSLGDGIHADLKLPAEGGKLPFSLKLKLRGSRWLGWLPMGEETKVVINSPWPHPSFGGHMLPASRTINDKGFSAQWQASHLATNLPQRLEQVIARSKGECRPAAPCDLEELSSGVSFNQPVDVYQQAERSVKYGFLFVMLTFAAFGLFEILKNLPIHPVQYGLVGIALALFFLLLLALSEHLAFGLSYLAAAGGCVGLLGFYLGHVLHSRLRGLVFSGWLALLYAALYGLLVSEDNALLMGAILLFALLACAMVATRKVDWYQLGNTESGKE